MFSIFLRPFSWNVSIFLCCTGVSCSESIPYNSFAMIIASNAVILKLIGHVVCTQKTSNLLSIAIHVDILLEISWALFEFSFS